MTKTTGLSLKVNRKLVKLVFSYLPETYTVMFVFVFSGVEIGRKKGGCLVSALFVYERVKQVKTVCLQ